MTDNKNDKQNENSKKEFRINRETVTCERQCNGDDCQLFQDDEDFSFDDD